MISLSTATRVFLASTPTNDSHETAGSMGNENDLFCLRCARTCQLESTNDDLVCPDCGSSNLRGHMELDGATCPKCRKDTLGRESQVMGS